MFDPVVRLGCRILVIAAATGAAAACVEAPSALAAPSCTTGGAGVVTGFCFQPSSTAAGSDSTLNTEIDFNYPTKGDTLKNLIVTLAPGLLAIPTAVPVTCANDQLSLSECPAGSQVGSGQVNATGKVILTLLPLTLTASAAMYVMNPSDCDAVVKANKIDPSTVVACFGLDVWAGKPKPGKPPLINLDAPATVQTGAGAPVAQFGFYGLPPVLTIGGLQADIQVNWLKLNINGTAPNPDGTPGATPFTRLPTSCAAPATTSLAVDTYSGTGDGTGGSSFTPTGCASLKFGPSLSASSALNPPGVGSPFDASLSTTVSQPAGQAAASSIALAVPTSTLVPDALNAATSFGDLVGSATAVSPLLAAPLVGTVRLTGDLAAPTLTITLPPPVPLTLTGSLVLPSDASPFTDVTFAGLPDVPLSSLTVTIDGGGNALWATTCAQPSGTISGAFTGQNGAGPVNVDATLAVANCQLPSEEAFPPAIPTTGGPPTTPTTTTTPTTPAPGTPPIHTAPRPKPPHLSGGSLSGLSSGHAKLRFTLAAGSSKLSAFTVGLPSGLAFDVKTFRRGVSVSGGKVRSLRLSRGRLVVSLRSAVSRLRVTVAADALNEVSALRGRVKARKVKKLSVTVVARDAKGHSSLLRLTLRV